MLKQRGLHMRGSVGAISEASTMDILLHEILNLNLIY